MRKDRHLLFTCPVQQGQSTDQNPAGNLGASNLVECVCFEIRVTCSATTCILSPVTERLLFLGQMSHVSLTRSW